MVDEAEVTYLDEPQGQALVNVLYSLRRDVYTVPSANCHFWLSVEVQASPSPGHCVGTAREGAWRRHYKGVHFDPGHIATLPADDVLVVDYMAQAKAEEL